MDQNDGSPKARTRMMKIQLQLDRVLNVCQALDSKYYCRAVAGEMVPQVRVIAI